jgi:pyocin large subunit-like protein
MGVGWNKASAMAALGGAALLCLSACDRGPASIPARDHEAAAPAAAASTTSSSDDRVDGDLRVATTRDDPRDAAVPLFHGRPMWAANRRHTAEENARYQFARDGADFGARDMNDFVAKAHAFVDHPPHGVETLTRDNGDRLLYDPSNNVFAVVSRDGAPRTMFKPRDGAAYWQEQKDRVAEEDQGGDDQSGSYSGSYRSHRRREGDAGEDDGQG